VKSTCHQVVITPTEVQIDGKRLHTESTGHALLTEVYRALVDDYPKFFKMDTLCKVGFLASELLLQQEGDERFVPRDDRAVVLFCQNASIQSDRAFEETIRDREQFFPSPAVFVYTLPNIVTGEIAIRNKYMGETNLIVLPQRDDQLIRQHAGQLLKDGTATSVITGWIDASDNEHFEADMWVV
jgi:3-oxoacyl-[acyl-carrier-protein] synthase-1